MKWMHKTMKRGRISFAIRQSAEIVDGVFEAPDDPALAERLKKAGHTPVPEEVTADGEGQNGAPAPNEERPAGGSGSKKGR